MAQDQDFNLQDAKKFIDRVSDLDDIYKVYLFSALNAIFLFCTFVIGVSIDPTSIQLMTITAIINTLKSPLAAGAWMYVEDILTVVGFIQLGITAYGIWKYKLTGIIIAVFAFSGWFALLESSKYTFKEWELFVFLGMIIVSYLLARRGSKLKFDKDGRVIYNGS